MTTTQRAAIKCRLNVSDGDINRGWHAFTCQDISEPPDAEAALLGLQYIGLACTADYLELKDVR